MTGTVNEKNIFSSFLKNSDAEFKVIPLVSKNCTLIPLAQIKVYQF